MEGQVVMEKTTGKKSGISVSLILQISEIKSGLGNKSWTKLFFFSMFRPLYLIYAYGSPEKNWLVYVKLLALRLFNFFIFLGDSLPVVAE